MVSQGRERMEKSKASARYSAIGQTYTTRIASMIFLTEDTFRPSLQVSHACLTLHRHVCLILLKQGRNEDVLANMGIS